LLRNPVGESEEFIRSIERIKEQGVPNYFGEQRFGFQGNNLNKAHDWFTKGYKVKQRNKRSLLLSSARSYIFNKVLSERIAQGSWLKPSLGEPLNLEGSKSTFICEDTQESQECMHRIDDGDVHTTGVLWGNSKAIDESTIGLFEQEVLADDELFRQGLEKADMSMDRRALRCLPQNMEYQINEDEIRLSFRLQKGQYATMVLRELLNINTTTDD